MRLIRGIESPDQLDYTYIYFYAKLYAWEPWPEHPHYIALNFV